MAMMSSVVAYCDASGHERNARPLVVAALISPESEWRKFESGWDAIMESYHVPYLRMAEINPYPFREPYRVWCDDRGRREAFFTATVKLTKRHVHKIITMYIHPADFNEVNQIYDLNYIGDGAFPLLAMACAGRVHLWMEKNHPGQSLAYVHEDGDSGMPHFMAMMSELRRVDPRRAMNIIPRPARDPQTQKWFGPFQAADMIAWEVAREWAELRAEERTFSRRGLLSVILKQLDPETNLFPKEAVYELARQFPARFPRRDAA